MLLDLQTKNFYLKFAQSLLLTACTLYRYSVMYNLNKTLFLMFHNEELWDNNDTYLETIFVVLTYVPFGYSIA